MFRQGDNAEVVQKIWSQSGLFVARPGETVRIDHVYDCPSGNQIVAISKDGYGVSDIVCIPGSSPLRELRAAETGSAGMPNDNANRDGDIDPTPVDGFATCGGQGWTRTLVRLVGECVREQRSGYDVLASAAWDDVLRHWNTAAQPDGR